MKKIRIAILSLVFIALPLAIWATGDILFSGSDNSTNTLQGDIVYDRPSVWDGTNWDRWKGYAGAGGVVLQDGDSSTLTDVVDTGADNLANTLNGPVCYSELYGFDGTAWDRVLWTAAADNLSGTLAGLQSLAISLFFNGTNLQRWTGLAAGADNTSNSTPAPWVGSFLYGYDGSTWDRLTVTASGDAIGATASGLTTTSIIHGYDGTNNRRIKTDTSGQLIVNQSTSVPGYGRVQDGDSTVLLDVVDDGADNLANTLNSQVCSSEMYGFDGTAWDRIYATTMTGSTDDVDGLVGLNVAAGLYARVDDDTVGPLYKIATINSLKSDISSIAGTATDVNSGNKSNGSQRVVIATDDVNMSAINTSLAVIDDWDSSDTAKMTISAQTLTAVAVSKDQNANATGNRLWETCNVDQLNGTTVSVNTGAMDNGTQRVTLSTDDPAVASLSVLDDWDNGSDQLNVDIAAISVTAFPVSKDTNVNATDNRIWTTCNQDQLNGTTVSVSSGAKDNGTQRVILASDDAAVTSMSVLDDWDTTLALGLNIHGHDANVSACQMFGRSAAGSVTEIAATSTTGSTDDYDGNTSLQCVSVLAARIDDDNVEHVYQTSGHALKTDETSIAGTATDVNSGNKSNGSQRVVIATDDVNLSAINASLAVIDDWDSSDTAKVTISAQTATALTVSPTGAVNAQGNPFYVAVSDDTSANSATNPIYIEKVPKQIDADNTANCVAITDTDTDRAMTDTTDFYRVCAYGNTAYVNCAAANPAVDHTIGNFAFIVGEGECSEYRISEASCAVIGVASSGFLCFYNLL